MSITTTALSLHDFPPEIVQQFLSQMPPYGLPYSPYNHQIDLGTVRTISACRLTCQYLNMIARPFHFHTVGLGCSAAGMPKRCFERITQFLAMLEEDPTIAPNVHEFWLYGARFESPQSLRVVSELWTNNELPKIFAHLTSLKTFAFEAQPSLLASLTVIWDGTLGEEMQQALRRLVSMPTVTSLKFSHLTALPMDLLTSCPNLRHLDVDYIDNRPTPVLEKAPRSGTGQKVESIKAGMMCHSLLSILGYTSATLRDLMICLRKESIYSDILDPRLDQYTSLTYLRVHINSSASPIYIGNLSAFLKAQFKGTSLSITHLEVQAMEIQDSDFFNGFWQPVCARPTQWQRLEDAIQASFPYLSKLVIELRSRIIPEHAERLKVFVKWVLPVITEMQSVQVLLRFGLIDSDDNKMDEVDMAGIDVDVAGYIFETFGRRIGTES